MSSSEKRLVRILANQIRPKTAVSIISGADADLATEDEKELLYQVAEGKDPFEIRRQERAQDAIDGEDRNVGLHFSYRMDPSQDTKREQAKEFLQSQVKKFAKHPVDPEFGKKNPELHRFLMGVYKALQKGREIFEKLPEPMSPVVSASTDELMRRFRTAYRALEESMHQLRDYYRDHGHIADKWVQLVKLRFEDYLPVYKQVTQE